jgi:TPR repeat protein
MRFVSIFLLFFTGSVLADASLYERGKAYYYGQGVEQDYEKSFNAFKHSSKIGSIEAKTALAMMYIEGKGVAQDDDKGLELLN